MRLHNFIIVFLFVCLSVSPVHAWWDSYGYRYTIINTSALDPDIPFSINDTGLVNGTPIWTRYGAGCTGTMYVYSTQSGPSGQLAVANDSTECYWENGTSRTGNGATQVYPSGIKGWWHLEDTSGKDSSQNGRNGTTTGSPSLTNGVFDNAIDFDGVNDRIGLGTASIISGDNAIGGWFNLTELPSVDGDQQPVLGKYEASATSENGEFYLYSSNNNNKIYCSYRVSSAWKRAITSWTVSKETLYFAVCVWDESNNLLTLYVDGASNATLDITGPSFLGEAADNLYIGRSDGTANYFNGMIDSPFIINNSLSSSEVQQLYWNGIGNLTSLGSEETAPVTGVDVDIYAPTNTTYYQSNNFSFVFSATSTNNPNFTLKAYLDSNLTYNNTSYINNTNITIYRNLSIGVQNFTVRATDGAEESSSEVIFTVEDYTISGVTYNTTAFETGRYPYTLSIRYNLDDIQNITAALNVSYNGTEKSFECVGVNSTTCKQVNSTHYLFSNAVHIPLMSTNNSNISHFWSVNVTYLNGSSVSEQTATKNQSVIFLYHSPNQTQDKTDLIETENFINVVMLQTSGALPSETDDYGYPVQRLFNVTTDYQNTTYNMSGATTTLQKTINSGSISNTNNTNETYSVNSTAEFLFSSLEWGNQSRSMQTDTDNITIWKIAADDCSSFNTTAITFSVYDEINETIITNSTVEVVLNLSVGNINREYSLKLNSTPKEICISPSFGQYLLDAFLVFYADNYPQRSYYIYKTVSNQTDTINLYLLDNNHAYSSIIYLRTESGQIVPDYYVKLQRFYPYKNTYEQVTVCKTDTQDGKCTTYLQIEDGYYRIIIEDTSHTTVQTENPTTIVCTPFEGVQSCPPYPVVIMVDWQTDFKFLTVLGQYDYSCSNESYVEDTGVLRCTINDRSGVNSNIFFRVQKLGAVIWEDVCSQNSTDPSTTFVCNLGNVSGKTIRYELYGVGSPAYIFSYGLFNFGTQTLTWGLQGIFLTLILTLVFAFAGHFNPAAGVSFSVVGVIIGYLLQMITITTAGVAGIVLVAILYIIKAGGS